MRTTMICSLGALLSLAFGCVEARATRALEAPADGGTSPPMLSSPSAFWRGPGDLRVVVAVSPEAPHPISLDPALFALRTADGERVHALAADLGACEARETSTPGESARCTLRFALEGQPLALEHPAGPVPLPACSPDRPFGLCPPRMACVDGACLELCSSSHQDGACTDDDEVCDRGRCVPRCGDDPSSGCEEGRCVEGLCELSCRSVAVLDVECWPCFWDALDAGRCAVEDRCRDCADCPGSRAPGEAPRTSCGCLETAACDGCEEPSTRYWACLLEACPVCAE